MKRVHNYNLINLFDKAKPGKTDEILRCVAIKATINEILMI